MRQIAVDHGDQRAHRSRDQEHGNKVAFIADQSVQLQGNKACHHTDAHGGQVKISRDHDDHHAQGGDAVENGIVDHAEEVRCREHRRFDEGKHRQNQDKQQHPDHDLIHFKLSFHALSPPYALVSMDCSASSVSSLDWYSPVKRPLFMTRIRLQTERISGRSSEITIIPIPSLASLLIVS